MGSYPTFWLTLFLTNVMGVLPIFAMKWWLIQYVSARSFTLGCFQFRDAPAAELILSSAMSCVLLRRS